MATQTQYETKWLHNRGFLATIADEFPDWMVTVMFYTAVHAVETLFAHDGTHVVGGHTARNQTLKGTRRYQNIWRSYLPLYDAARAARYEVDAMSWVPVADVKQRLVPHLYRVENSVIKLTGASKRLEKVW